MDKRQHMSDSDIIHQYKDGNKVMLTLLVKRYHQLFCEKAYWITKNRRTSKDVVQDSWIKIINKLHTLNNANSFRSWALRIVYNKAIDKVKSSIEEKQKLKTVTYHVSQHTHDHEGNLAQKMHNLSTAIKQMPKEKQDVIRLFYSEEYSIKEISVFLKIPVGTVKSRLFKAREQLKLLINSIDYEK